MLRLFTVSILLCLVIVTEGAQTCHDIDSSACQAMFEQRPDLCSDMTIAKTACPRFCNLCPPVCYHCNTTVRDFHECNKTMTCQEGQICMKKELRSVFDAHHEYEMTCAEKRACDNPWNGATVFGKRHVQSRDVSVTCCTSDLCNYPKPACVKDLVIVVDESGKMLADQTKIKQFLLDVVRDLPVSSAGVHAALGLFSRSSSRNIFDLNELNSKSETLMAISKLSLSGSHHADATEGLKYVLQHGLTSPTGDRPEAQNVVLFVTAHGTSHGAQMLAEEKQVLSYAEVISVEINLDRNFQQLASDANHSFHITSVDKLQHIVSSVKTLICKDL